MTALQSGSSAAFAQVPGLNPLIEAAGVEAYKTASSQAYRAVFLVSLAMTGIGMILCIFLPDVDHLITANVSVQIHERGKDFVDTDEKV
jgi:hypothetical protein